MQVHPKGSKSSAAELSLVRQSCVRHVQVNVQTRYPGAFGAALKPWLYGLAVSATARSVEATFKGAAKELGKDARWNDAERYLKQRHTEEFDRVALLEMGFPDYGELLSNAAEQFNHSARGARRLGFLSATLLILKNEAKKYFSRGQKAAAVRTGLTPAIIQKIENDCTKAKVRSSCKHFGSYFSLTSFQTLEITMTGLTADSASASVAYSAQHLENVLLQSDGTILCSCCKGDAIGRACVCALSLQLHIARYV